MQRVRNSRAKLVERFRQSGGIQDAASGSALTHRQMALALMEGEWGGPLHQRMKAGSEDEQEALLAILEEVQNEMRAFSEQLADDIAKFEHSDVEHLINKCQDLEVICPVCQVRALQQQQVSVVAAPSPQQLAARVAAVACRCGLSLSGVSLQDVDSSLQQTLLLHNKDCQQSLSFSATTVPATAHQGLGPASSTFSSTPLGFGSSQSGGTPLMVSNVLVTCSQCDWMSFLI